jgi:hypothetical protein
MPRAQREKRAYNLVVLGGVSAAVAVIGFVLAIVGVMGIGIPLVAAIVAVVCWLWFRSIVSPR